MSDSQVKITHEGTGFDISAIVGGEKVKTNWRPTFNMAYGMARNWADYYQDDNGQSLKIVIPDDIVIE